jgi:hypothetical protein
MTTGRVDVQMSERRGKARLRVYDAAMGQLSGTPVFVRVRRYETSWDRMRFGMLVCIELKMKLSGDSSFRSCRAD